MNTFRQAMETVRKNDVSGLYQLLDNNPGLVKEKLPVDGDTLLHLAVRRVGIDGEKIKSVISVLLEYGADWDVPNTTGSESPKDLLMQIQAVPAML